MLTKSDLRKKIRAQRSELSLDEVRFATKKISEKIIQHPLFLQAKKIACYIANDNEIELSDIINQSYQLKKEIYLPVMSDQNNMLFYEINAETKFKKNKFKIDEPIIDNQKPISPEALDLILIPLVAFDVHGNRLGRGAGYYDRALQSLRNQSHQKKTYLVGVAYAFQKIDCVPTESHDVPLDWVITEKNEWHCSIAQCDDSIKK